MTFAVQADLGKIRLRLEEAVHTTKLVQVWHAVVTSKFSRPCTQFAPLTQLTFLVLVNQTKTEAALAVVLKQTNGVKIVGSVNAV